LTRLIIKNV